MRRKPSEKSNLPDCLHERRSDVLDGTGKLIGTQCNTCCWKQALGPCPGKCKRLSVMLTTLVPSSQTPACSEECAAFIHRQTGKATRARKKAFKAAQIEMPGMSLQQDVLTRARR